MTPDGYIKLQLQSSRQYLYVMLFRLATYWAEGYGTKIQVADQEYNVVETPEQISALIEEEKKRHRQYLKDVKEETL